MLTAEAVSLSPSPTLHRNQLKLSGCLLSQHSRHRGETAAWRPSGTMPEWWMSTAPIRNLQRDCLTVLDHPRDVGGEGATRRCGHVTPTHLCLRDLGVSPAPHLPSSLTEILLPHPPPWLLCVRGWLQGLQNLELCHV